MASRLPRTMARVNGEKCGYCEEQNVIQAKKTDNPYSFFCLDCKAFYQRCQFCKSVFGQRDFEFQNSYQDTYLATQSSFTSAGEDLNFACYVCVIQSLQSFIRVDGSKMIAFASARLINLDGSQLRELRDNGQLTITIKDSEALMVGKSLATDKNAFYIYQSDYPIYRKWMGDTDGRS